jgi:hypothetical protein
MTNHLPLITATTGIATRLRIPDMEDFPVRHRAMHKVRSLTITPVVNTARHHPITVIVPCMFFSRSKFLFLGLTDEWSRPRCSDSPPVSPTSTPTPDYFVPQSSSSSASSPTSPASPYHYGWQPPPTHQPDGSSGNYIPTELPPQYNPFQPCVYRVIYV